jgi:RNA polymerase sigma-70 factor (ECF subfamily)
MLTQAFLDALPAGSRVNIVELEPALTRLVDRAHIAWPELAIDGERFIAHVASLATGTDVTDATLSATRIDDLTLAFACATQVAGAAGAFERRYTDDVRAIVARLGGGPELIDEIRQRLRERLFVAEPDRSPGISRYTGKGELLAFVRVTALRIGLDLLRARGARKETGDQALADLTTAETPELQYLRTLYRREFKAAFEAAIARLPPRSRTLFRYEVLDRLSIDKIAAIYAVHRSTVARQLHHIRRGIVAATRDELARRMHLSASEIASVMRLIQSDLDLSLERILRGE